MNAVTALPLAALLAATAPAQDAALRELDGSVQVTLGRDPFTEYRWKGQPKPVLYPVIGAAGKAVTRGHPLEERPDEVHDHPHHRSLWFAHGDVNGHDFWAEGPTSGRIVHVEVRTAVEEGVAVITARDRWVARDGTAVCSDRRRLAFFQRDGRRFIDYEVTLVADRGRLRLGDTKEGTMAMRLAPELRLEGPVAGGTAVSSAGVRGKAVWGKRAAWVDYNGVVDGRRVGVAILDHPSNHAHPTWWHARAYGLFAANPFGVHDFTGRPRGEGAVVVPAGGELTLSYRFVFHEGDEEEGAVAAEFERFRSAPVGAARSRPSARRR